MFEASPKAISGRTSYLRVRLEFLRHPQLISDLFNGHEFGPPRNFTSASTCTWLDHWVSGLPPTTQRALHTRFRYASSPEGLKLAADGKSQDHYAKGTLSDCLAT